MTSRPAPGQALFPHLTGAEQNASYSSSSRSGTRSRGTPKAWGAPHTGPGVRFICDSDAIDDPDHKGFWTPLWLWNRWRHETYKDNREAEMQYLDKMPETADAPAPGDAKPTKKPPEVKNYFTKTGSGTHTVGGDGKTAGQVQPCTYYACKKPGCLRGPANPMKQVGSGTGQLFSHLKSCQPALAEQLLARSSHSKVMYDADGNIMTLFSFKELLPHHIRYVIKCARGFDHFYETRADNGLLEYVQGFEPRAVLPGQKTCMQILAVIEELMDEQLLKIIGAMKKEYGTPFCGSTTDTWSLKSCRHSFFCFRGSFLVDGDLLAGVVGDPAYRGKLVDLAPVMGFDRIEETHHTGQVIARWKKALYEAWDLVGAVGLATEDGASNNKTANRILGQEYKVCMPHDLARGVMHAIGETKNSKNPVSWAEMRRDRPEIDPRSTRDRPEIDPRPTRDRPEIDPRPTRDRPEIDHNATTLPPPSHPRLCPPLPLPLRCRERSVNKLPGRPPQELKGFVSRAGKQSAAFSRSVVANHELQQYQLDMDSSLKAHATLSTKTANKTRWTGLREMARHNRLLKPAIRFALTGDENGISSETPARSARTIRETDSSDESSCSDFSDGEDQAEGNIAANKKHPLAHRALSTTDWDHNNILESVLEGPYELTMLSQIDTAGLDLGTSYVLLTCLRDESRAPTLEIVSGAKDTETWREVPVQSLPAMFQTFRKVLAEQLSARFLLDTTPDKHTLLALKMHPAINTKADSSLFEGRSAMLSLSDAEYKRSLRRQGIRRLAAAAATAAPAAPPSASPRAQPAARQPPSGATAGARAAAADDAAPAAKRRKSGLMAGLAHAQQAQRPDGEPAADSATSAIDQMVAREIDSFTAINDKVVAQVMIKPNHSFTGQFNSSTDSYFRNCGRARTPRVLQGRQQVRPAQVLVRTQVLAAAALRGLHRRGGLQEGGGRQRGVRLLRRWQVHAGGEGYGCGVPAADRQGAQQLEVPVLAAHRGGDHRALHAEVRQGYIGYTVLHLAGPIELRRCRFSCAILGLGRPVDLRPRRRPTFRRPARWRRHVAAPARRCSGKHAICCSMSE